MAYDSGTVTRYKSGPYLVITIIETDAAAGSQTRLIEIPRVGEIVRITSKLISGTGTTVRPSAYWDAAAANDDSIFIDAGPAAAAFIDDATSFGYQAKTGRMYWESNVDAAADNVIESTIILKVG